MSLETSLAELKERKVFRAAGVYAVAGLGVIYAADAILPRLGLPEWTVTLVIVLVGLGFPLALGLAWAFDVTAEGVVRAPPASEAVESSDRVGHARGSTEADNGIVVLPFADMSPGADHEYFSDGLTEEIIADLAGIHSLSVISRTSAMQLKGTDKDVRAIGRLLGVRYVLEGSVRKAGDRLRITAQLIDAETDAHLWADKYDGSIQDVFDVQERVSREIVRALDITLTAEEDDRLSERPIEDARAFELYLQARQQLERYMNDGVADLLAEAVAIEGPTPPLRALEGWALVNQVRTGMSADHGPLDEAEQLARQLVDDAPRSHYGHALLGYVRYERGDFAESVRHFRAALEREPEDPGASLYLGLSLNQAGQIEPSLEVSRELLAADPLGPMSHMLAGAISMFLGEVGRAAQQFGRASELDPDNGIVHWCLGYVRALEGNVSGASTHLDFMRANLPPGFFYTIQLETLLDGMEGRVEPARESLAGVDIEPLDGHHLFHLSESYAMAREPDRALDLLERAVERGFYPAHFIADHCPFMEPLRGSSRFEAAVAVARQRMDAFSAS